MLTNELYYNNEIFGKEKYVSQLRNCLSVILCFCKALVSFSGMVENPSAIISLTNTGLGPSLISNRQVLMTGLRSESPSRGRLKLDDGKMSSALREGHRATETDGCEA